jgi:hypothetical protein
VQLLQGQHSIRRSMATWTGAQPSGAQVYLNVYDLTTQMNSWTYWCGVGVFHAGVEVYGIEYAYGGEEGKSWPTGFGCRCLDLCLASHQCVTMLDMMSACGSRVVRHYGFQYVPLVGCRA